MVTWNPTRTKIQLRLAVQRLRILQEKKEALAKKSRRDIATLLEKSKVETARIKVETMINEDIHVELLELLELYCELLLARFGILDQNSREPDPGVSEGVCSIIHAAPRTELKELHVLREMLMHKYGREFSIAVMENRENCVSERVMKKLTTATPSSELVDAYLGEIAAGYSINWSPKKDPKDEDKGSMGGDGGGGGLQEGVPTKELEPALLADSSAKSPASSVQLPSLPPVEDEKQQIASSPRPTTPANEDPEDFDALVKRFAALKRK